MLTMEVNDLYNTNFTTLNDDTEKDKRIWKDFMSKGWQN